MRFTVSFAAAALVALAPAVACAQTAPAGSKLDGDHITVGGGAVYGPSYEGSDDYVVSPFPVVRGRVHGIEINPRAAGIALDLIPDGEHPKVGFQLGPVATYSGNRHRQIKDPVVRAAGKLKEAIGVGVNAGITAYGLLNDFDSVTVSADAVWNVNKAHRGLVITPSVSYLTPLSRGTVITLGVHAKHVDDDYADYYYSVSPAQNAASGLPLYQAKGGWASYGAAALVGIDFDGDLTNGGLAGFVAGSYDKLTEDARRTPYTSLRGDADQWLVALGLAYTF